MSERTDEIKERMDRGVQFNFEGPEKMVYELLALLASRSKEVEALRAAAQYAIQDMKACTADGGAHRVEILGLERALVLTPTPAKQEPCDECHGTGTILYSWALGGTGAPCPKCAKPDGGAR